jgi:hypothetical protein
MKKGIYLLILTILMSISSCDNFLEPKPTDFLNPESYYETEAQLLAAKTSVYSVLGAFNFHGARTHYLYAWCADEGYMNRSTLTTGPWNYFYSSSDGFVQGLWSTLYYGINRANTVLDNLDNNPEIAQEKRDLIRGEMLFLRGYFYFTLVQNWGGVPLKLETTTDIINVDIPRNTVKEVYDQILKDMETAETLVPSITTLGYSGAISKSAVRGILARVNLNMAGAPLNDASRYAEASKWAKKVIDDGAHALNPSFPQIFINIAQDKYDIKESIWEVEFWGNQTDQYTEGGFIGYINGTYSFNNLNTGRCDAYMSTTSKIYNIFEQGDNRKWWVIPHFIYNATGESGAKTLVVWPSKTPLPLTEDNKNRIWTGKFRREYETLTPKGNPYSPQNAILLRYSDVLLMYAEAENQIKGGPSAEAIEAVNKVRQRAWSTGINTISVTSGGSGYTTAPTVTITGGGGAGGATATAVVTEGVVTAVTLDRDLTGVKYYKEGDYTTVPEITIAGGGGTGATATATIYKKTDANLTSAQTSSKESFLAAIQDERMRELTYENHRKSDLIRWDIFLKVNKEMGDMLQQQSPGLFFVKYYSNVTQRNLLWPIPAVEMTTNQAMVQNPGWE